MNYYYSETYESSLRTPHRSSTRLARADLEALRLDGELYRINEAGQYRKLAEFHVNEGWSG